MKKNILCFASSLLMASSLMSGGAAVSAKDAQLNPDCVLNRIRCGKVVVKSEIERDVYIKIECETPDAPAYLYYDEVIESESGDPVCNFILEGNDEAVYTVTIGVPKYKGSQTTQDFSEEFVIYDVDEIEAQDVAGYLYSYTVCDGEELKSEKTADNKKDDNDIITSASTLYFPIEDLLKGDSNQDGSVNIRDAAFIAGCVARNKVSELSESADFNGDGNVNIRDAAAIAQHIAKGGK